MEKVLTYKFQFPETKKLTKSTTAEENEDLLSLIQRKLKYLEEELVVFGAVVKQDKPPHYLVEEDGSFYVTVFSEGIAPKLVLRVLKDRWNMEPME